MLTLLTERTSEIKEKLDYDLSDQRLNKILHDFDKCVEEISSLRLEANNLPPEDIGLLFNVLLNATAEISYTLSTIPVNVG